MIARVINLDRAADRLSQFMLSNGHILPFQRFAAVDGRLLNRWDLEHQGILSKANRYTPAAQGIAMSHILLWRECKASGQPMLICEDDAILRADFAAASSSAMGDWDRWDLISWTYNFDWPVVIDAGPGVPAVMLDFDQDGMRRDIAQFLAETGPSPQILPLRSQAGTPCYSVSPKGAARLLALCLPLGAENASYGGQRNHAWINTGIDVEIARHCAAGSLRAYASFPPLALTANDHSISSNYR